MFVFNKLGIILQQGGQSDRTATHGSVTIRCRPSHSWMNACFGCQYITGHSPHANIHSLLLLLISGFCYIIKDGYSFQNYAPPNQSLRFNVHVGPGMGIRGTWRIWSNINSIRVHFSTIFLLHKSIYITLVMSLYMSIK